MESEELLLGVLGEEGMVARDGTERSARGLGGVLRITSGGGEGNNDNENSIGLDGSVKLSRVGDASSIVSS